MKTKQPEGWEIDLTTGTPILTFEKCSVIQDAQADLVMRLLVMEKESHTCRCECETHGHCEHDFTGHVVYTKNSGSVTCRHCGMTAMSHDVKLMDT